MHNVIQWLIEISNKLSSSTNPKITHSQGDVSRLGSKPQIPNIKPVILEIDHDPQPQDAMLQQTKQMTTLEHGSTSWDEQPNNSISKGLNEDEGEEVKHRCCGYHKGSK